MTWHRPYTDSPINRDVALCALVAAWYDRWKWAGLEGGEQPRDGVKNRTVSGIASLIQCGLLCVVAVPSMGRWKSIGTLSMLGATAV